MSAADRDAAQGADIGLLRSIGAGDREALRHLYLRYFPRLSRFLSRITNQPSIIEELINDTMLIVWRRAAEFRGDSEPSTWILGIAYRRALKALKRRSAEGRRLVTAGATDSDAEQSAVSLLERAETDDWLACALEHLSAEQRLAVELAYFMGLSCDEIAEATDCPPGTVKTRLFYARQRLREVLVTLAAPRPSARERS